MADVIRHEQIRPLVEEFAARLAATGASAGIRIVGGAAVSLHGFERRPTRDIDAVILRADDTRSIVAAMAEEFGLAPDWWNDSAKAFIPAVGLEDWIEVHQAGEVTVSIASVHLLLAMKLFANRARRDWEDLHMLLEAAGIATVEEAQEIYERYHAQELIPDSAVLRIQAWLDRR